MSNPVITSNVTVGVTTTPINVTVSAQGSRGPVGPSGAGSSTTNIVGLISTGSADLRYLNSGVSGSFSERIENTGTNILSKEQRIRTEIFSGSGQLFVNYNSSFSSIPVIWCQIQTSGGSVNYYVNSSGIRVDGYTAVFSDIIRETGVFLYTLAKIL